MILNCIISLFFIILIHELSHLIVAKICKVGVEIYSIGLGKKLFGFKFHNTEYRISLIPFGGYCKLEGETNLSKSPTAFSNKRYSLKLFVILAGCIANMITGLIALYLIKPLFLFGYLSFWMGVANLIPFPALDGAFPFLLLLEKKYGKEKGLKIVEKIVRYGFTILMILQVYFIIFLIFNWNEILFLIGGINGTT